MPPYEVLALVALAAVGGFAYYVSRKDLPAGSPGQDSGEPPKSIFARDPKVRDGGKPRR